MADLAEILRRRIAVDGPLTVAEYMGEALGHPTEGYYMNRDPLGAGGDFTTSPEISQVFGELVGAWCAVVWQAMGGPGDFVLAELGPGRGTLMADALRATRTVAGFHDALRVHLVEASPRLRAIQGETLAKSVSESAPTWHDSFAGVPEEPLVLVANEFFDALPIRQFERAEEGWRERLVDADDDTFRFVLGPPSPAHPLIPPGLAAAPAGSVVEVCPPAISLAHAIGSRLAGSGGAALIVDYGHAGSAAGDTLQAVKGHAYHPVLADPGEADLTAHVDFAALARSAREAGARVHGPVTQGTFLDRLGVAARAETLLAAATPGQATDIRAARERLTAADQMGTLFRVLAIANPELEKPPGFE